MDHASISRAGKNQEIAWIGGSTHRVGFDSADTDGRLTALMSSMRRGAASPVHIHDQVDETIFVRTGHGVFWAGRERWSLAAGDSIFLPRGLAHTYLFTADSEILTICNPAGMEEMFRTAGWDLSEPVPEGWAVDMATLNAASEASGARVLGPPLNEGDDMPERYLETRHG